MPQIFKAETSVHVMPSMLGIRNILAIILYKQSFGKLTARRKSRVCQLIAAVVSILMIVPVAVLIYFVVSGV